jgi:hypothetical protein
MIHNVPQVNGIKRHGIEAVTWQLQVVHPSGSLANFAAVKRYRMTVEIVLLLTTEVV